jgi:hypothetical protein
MLDQSPDAVTRVTCIGAGPIGGGWAAHFLARGYHVTSYLHDAAEHDALMRLLETAWTSLEAIGLAPGASLDNFNWTTDLAEATADAEFIQESVPEVLALKQALYRTLGFIQDPGRYRRCPSGHCLEYIGTVDDRHSGRLRYPGTHRGRASVQPSLFVAAGGNDWR